MNYVPLSNSQCEIAAYQMTEGVSDNTEFGLVSKMQNKHVYDYI